MITSAPRSIAPLIHGAPAPISLICTGDRIQTIGGAYPGRIMTVADAREYVASSHPIDGDVLGWKLRGRTTTHDGRPFGELHYGGVDTHVIYLGDRERARHTARDLLRLPVGSPSAWLHPHVGGGHRVTLENGCGATILGVTDESWRFPSPPTRAGDYVRVGLLLEGRTQQYALSSLLQMLGAVNAQFTGTISGQTTASAVFPGWAPIAVTHATVHTCGADPGNACQNAWYEQPCPADRDIELTDLYPYFA